MSATSPEVDRSSPTEPGPAAPSLVSSWARVCLVFVVGVSVGTLAGLWLSGSGYQSLPDPLPDSGAFTSWAWPAFKGLSLALGIAVVGLLLYAAILSASNKSRYVTPAGRRAITRAAVLSLVWAVVTWIAASLFFAVALGQTWTAALNPELWSVYAWDIIPLRSLLISGLIALVLSIGLWFTARATAATWWLAAAVIAIALPALTGHSSTLGDHAIAMVGGVSHAVAASLWVGGLLAIGVATFTGRKAPNSTEDFTAATLRFSNLALAAVIVLLVSGVAFTYASINGPSELVTTGYGRVVLIKIVAFMALMALALRLRKRILPALAAARTSGSQALGRTFALAIGLELAVMTLASGLGAALTLSAPPRTEQQFATLGEQILGKPFPPAPTFGSVMFGWQLDLLFAGLAVAAAVLYLAGVMRLKKRGDHWSWAKTTSWLIGIVVFLWSTSGGIAVYAEVSVGWHMVQHMAITMLSPIPLVLGAPIQLALRALPPSPTGGRGPREFLLGALHSRFAAIITNPVVVVAIYAGSLYVLYFTSLFGILMSNHAGHIFMTGHFVISGLLFTWVVIGIDPRPKPLAHWARLVMVFVTIVLHAFFALAMMQTTIAVGDPWFVLVQPPWIEDVVKDSMIGGQVAWGIAELPSLLLMVIIGIQWSRSDLRAGKRRDRYTYQHGDTELADYNAYLKALQGRSDDWEERHRGERPPASGPPIT